MSSRHDGEPGESVLAKEDDWFSTPFQEPTETGEIIWQDDPEPPPRPASSGLGQRQAIVVLASVVAVVVIAGGILLVRSLGGSDGATTTPGSTTPTATTPAATTPAGTSPTPTTPTTTTPSTASVPTDAVLRAGSSGTAVVTLQQALTKLGYPPGAADGNFGPATTQAVIAFQKAQGLPQDGVAGPKTLAAINAALAGG